MNQKPKCLVIQTAFLGDLILTIPLLRLLSESYQVHMVVKRGLGELFKDQNYIHCIYEVDKRKRDSYQRVVNEFKDKNFSVIYCPHNSIRSALFSFQIKASKKVAYKKWWNKVFFNERVEELLEIPKPLRLIGLVKSLNKQEFVSLNKPHKNGKLPGLPHQYSFSSQNFKQIKNEKRIAFFAGSEWGTKKWPLEKYFELSQNLKSLGWKVFWLGSKKEGDELDVFLGSNDIENNLCGKMNLRDTIEFLKSCSLCVSNDSGGGHLASLAGIPIVSIFGPTVIEFGFRPWAETVYIVENKNLNCRPCGVHGPQKCPLSHHNCMNLIEVDQVKRAVQLALS